MRCYLRFCGGGDVGKLSDNRIGFKKSEGGEDTFPLSLSNREDQVVVEKVCLEKLS
jgi:hypothetical protein